VLSLAAAFLLTTVSRIIFSNIADNDLLRRRVIVYGAGRRASTLLQLRRRSDQRGFRIVSFIPTAGDEFVISDDRVARTERSLFEHANENEAEQIVMAMDDRRRAYPIEDLHKCKFSGIDVIDIVEFLERESGKVKIDLLNPSSIIFASRFTRGDSPVLVSSLFDIVVALVTLVLALPIMLITALGILLEDGRPILYRQTRVGRQGRDFELLKFRSMRKDAEKDGARWAEMQDSRVTRIGSIIRPLRIDELPQLLNILRGDMRIIGPRPERPEFVEQLVKSIPYYHERHSVKPGLTGWAQLCYPYGASEKDAFEKLQFDLYYVKHRSLVFDLVILLQTVEVILWKKGAR
jgi:sugar transferase (PEP-CTERM system associated)